MNAPDTYQSPIPTVEGELNGTVQPLVNARDLHAFLQVGRDLTTWIESRIEKYGFVESEDFSRSPNRGSGENQGLRRFMPGANRVDYWLSLDMAKELCMIENSEQGRMLRKHFIRVERAMFTDVPAILRQLQDKVAALRGTALAANPTLAATARYFDMGLTPAEIGRLLGCTASAAQKRLRRLAELSLIDYRPDPRLSLAGRKGHDARAEGAA